MGRGANENTIYDLDDPLGNDLAVIFNFAANGNKRLLRLE